MDVGEGGAGVWFPMGGKGGGGWGRDWAGGEVRTRWTAVCCTM